MDLKPIVIALMLGTIPYTAMAGEGHDAGYEWAQENDIDDADYCNTPSTSFNEGCEEYVEENAPSLSSVEDDEE